MRQWFAAIALITVAACSSHSVGNSATGAVSPTEHVLDMLKAGEPKACLDNVVQQTALGVVAQYDPLTSSDFGEIQRAGGSLPPFDRVTMTGKNAGIWVMACSGNFQNVPINYFIRPSPRGDSFMVELKDVDRDALGGAVMLAAIRKAKELREEGRLPASDNGQSSSLNSQAQTGPTSSAPTATIRR